MKYLLFILCILGSHLVSAKLLPSDFKMLADMENNSQFDLAWHAKQAQYGDPESQFFMAKVYDEGKLVPQNQKMAIAYYRKAAEQGHVESMIRLSELVADEQTTWLEKAGQTNYVPAQLKLAQIYETENQKEKAMYWLEKAMRQMFPDVVDLTTVSPKLQELKAGL